MPVTVFVGAVKQCSYHGDPVNQFHIEIPVTIANAGPNADMRVYGPSDEMIYFDTESLPTDVYQHVYNRILAICTEYTFETPAKSDVYGYMPTNFTVILPEPTP